jgi:hypothetical protein
MKHLATILSCIVVIFLLAAILYVYTTLPDKTAKNTPPQPDPTESVQHRTRVKPTESFAKEEDKEKVRKEEIETIQGTPYKDTANRNYLETRDGDKVWLGLVFDLPPEQYNNPISLQGYFTKVGENDSKVFIVTSTSKTVYGD